MTLDTKVNENHPGYGMFKELESIQEFPRNLLEVLQRRDGAAQLVSELPKIIKPKEVASPSNLQRAWEDCGLWFLNQNRFHEAMPIFYTLYDQMLTHQEETKTFVHKGMPLVWISDCHAALGHSLLAKRYLMLTTCEDAISNKGEIPSEGTGTYFRLVWNYGISHEKIGSYATQIWKLFQDNPEGTLFPEWILQELDQEWIAEFPTIREATYYIVNKKYIRWLLNRLGSGDGKSLERLAHYLLGSIPGCRAYMRGQSKSTDYDVICVLEGLDLDFRSDLGRYFVCECKDWSKPADFSAFAKFCRVLDSTKCRFGILFSKTGITGAGRTTDAEREQMKVFQDRGMVVVVVDETDLRRAADGANFITILRTKYEEVRLDLRR